MSGIGDDFGCSVDVVGVEVCFFGFGDFVDLILGDFGDFGFVWFC